MNKLSQQAAPERFLHSSAVQRNINSPEIEGANHGHVTETARYVPIDSERLQGQQQIRIGVADPLDGPPKSVTLMPVSWSDSPGHRFQQQRSQLMADVLGSRVVTVGLPGMGGDFLDPHNRLSEKDVEHTKRGRMDTVAAASWQALEQDGDAWRTGEHGEQLPMNAWLNSLSTLSGSEMLAAAPEGVRFADVYFHESMALREMHVARLMAQYVLSSSRHILEYNKTNTGARVGSAEVPLVRQALGQTEAHFRTVEALAGGQQLSILGDVIAQDNPVVDANTRWHVVRAGEGLVRPEDHEKMLRFLNVAVRNRFGVTDPNIRSEVLHGEGHGIQDSLPALQAMLEQSGMSRR